jgi:putative methyltransferase (TIGR04325 family)
MHNLLKKLLNRRPKHIYQNRFYSRKEAFSHSKSPRDYGSKAYDSRAIKKLKFKERYTQGRNMIVPLVLSILNKDRCVILDIGGGVNAVFSHLNSTQKQQYQCFVLERTEVVSNLNSKIPIKNKNNLQYVDSADDIKMIDVAYFGSSIQYIENYKTLLKQISKLTPEFIIFSESIFTAEDEDYFVLQVNMFPDVFPNRFISENKLINLMRGLNYQCTYNRAVAGDFSHASIDRNSYDCKTLVFKRTLKGE